MIAEPYICIKGSRVGEIVWAPQDGEGTHLPSRNGDDIAWKIYADFEREKLKELGYCHVLINAEGRGYECESRYSPVKQSKCSAELIEYTLGDFCTDSESSRLLKRAEFLKAVCEKEGVEWLEPVVHQCTRCTSSEPCVKPFVLSLAECAVKIIVDGRVDELLRDLPRSKPSSHYPECERCTHTPAMKACMKECPCSCHGEREKKPHEHEWSDCAWKKDDRLFNRCHSCSAERTIRYQEIKCQECRKQFPKPEGTKPGFTAEEEREWRKALLDYLEWRTDDPTSLLRVQDLRSRFYDPRSN